MFHFGIYYVIITSNRVKILNDETVYERKRVMPADNKKRNVTNKQQAGKRKRVNRMKALIVVGAVILLFTSVILNFVLVFKVLQLESQIDKLYSVVPVSIAQEDFISV